MTEKEKFDFSLMIKIFSFLFTTAILVIVSTVIVQISGIGNDISSIVNSTDYMETVIEVYPIHEIEYIAINMSGEEINAIIGASRAFPDKYQEVVDKITTITGSVRVTEAIVSSCLSYKVSIAFAMGIVWTESRFNPHASNNKNGNGTTDWGLFEINDINIPDDWSNEAKMNIELNTARGVEIIHELIVYYDGNMVLVNAAYNAGKQGILDGISYDTLRHINSTLNFEKQVERNLGTFLLNL